MEDLKNARLVCRKWNEACSERYLDLSVVYLQPPKQSRDWEHKFEDYIENCKKVAAYGHTNYRICYSGHPTDGFLEEDILRFVEGHGNRFKTLELTIMPGRNDFAFLRDMLSVSELRNLEHISITLVSNESDYTSKYFPDGIRVPSVKSLSLNFGFSEDIPQHLFKFSPVLVNCFPNIVKFLLSTDDDTRSCKLEKVILKEFMDGISDRQIAASEDEEVIPGFEYLNEIHLQWATVQVVDLLIEFPKYLTTIDIHFSRGFGGVDANRIQNLIDKHAPALSEVRLAMHWKNGSKNQNEGRCLEPQMDIPVCPNLKKLVYNVYCESQDAMILSDVDLLNLRGLFLVSFLPLCLKTILSCTVI